jgi:hypothetical protein
LPAALFAVAWAPVTHVIVLARSNYMNAVSDTLLNRAEDKVETSRQEQKTEAAAALIELGRVSDTQGGWLGPKFDNGAGFTVY